MQDASIKIKQNQEASVKAVEGLNKMKSDTLSFSSQIAELKGATAATKVGDRSYSVEKFREGSKAQFEEQANKAYPVEKPAPPQV